MLEKSFSLRDLMQKALLMDDVVGEKKLTNIHYCKQY